MSIESGGTGDGKEKKASQYSGGWAKHAYGDEHPLSNRRLRRASKQELVTGRVRPPKSLKKAKNRDKVQTRKHLMDRFSPLEKNIQANVKYLKENKPVEQPVGKAYVYFDSYIWTLRSLAWDLAKRKKLLAEFDKYGYKRP